MLRMLLSSAVISALALLTASEAQAYGVTHTGYTHVSPNGSVQHYGSTTAHGPYGAASTSHYGSTSAYGGTVSHTGTTAATGAYGGAAVSSSGYHAYSPAAYGAYSGAGSASAAYSRSVVRYP
jgi:hypothetical protein